MNTQRKLIAAMSLCAAAVPGLSFGTLMDRGGGLIYDTDLNVTWLADANYAQTSDYDADGLMDWSSATTWAATLSYGGFSDWRLPSLDRNNDQVIVSCEGGGMAGCSDNEYGYLYWEYGVTATTPSPFYNAMSSHYWTNTEYLAFPPDVANFNFYSGGWNAILPYNLRYAMTVHDGDIAASTVPIPAAAWLFGSGLLGLVGAAKRRQVA